MYVHGRRFLCKDQSLVQLHHFLRATLMQSASVLLDQMVELSLQLLIRICSGLVLKPFICFRFVGTMMPLKNAEQWLSGTGVRDSYFAVKAQTYSVKTEFVLSSMVNNRTIFFFQPWFWSVSTLYWV